VFTEVLVVPIEMLVEATNQHHTDNNERVSAIYNDFTIAAFSFIGYNINRNHTRYWTADPLVL
jgi:hypothetical protein